jgi:hypothetical protein
MKGLIIAVVMFNLAIAGGPSQKELDAKTKEKKEAAEKQRTDHLKAYGEYTKKVAHMKGLEDSLQESKVRQTALQDRKHKQKQAETDIKNNDLKQKKELVNAEDIEGDVRRTLQHTGNVIEATNKNHDELLDEKVKVDKSIQQESEEYRKLLKDVHDKHLEIHYLALQQEDFEKQNKALENESDSLQTKKKTIEEKNESYKELRDHHLQKNEELACELRDDFMATKVTQNLLRNVDQTILQIEYQESSGTSSSNTFDISLTIE